MERRLASATAHAQLLDQLINPAPGEDFALFETKEKALMFAAALGVHVGRRTPLASRDASAAIRFDIFEKAMDDGFVHCLAICETGGLAILADSREEELAQIFEEYACTGLNEIQARVVGQPEPLQALVHLMNDARFPLVEEGLEGLDSDVLVGLLGR